MNDTEQGCSTTYYERRVRELLTDKDTLIKQLDQCSRQVQLLTKQIDQSVSADSILSISESLWPDAAEHMLAIHITAVRGTGSTENPTGDCYLAVQGANVSKFFRGMSLLEIKQQLDQRMIVKKSQPGLTMKPDWFV